MPAPTLCKKRKGWGTPHPDGLGELEFSAAKGGAPGYIPNLAWYTDFHADRQYSHETEKKEEVTHKICWNDDNRKQHCE